MAEDKQSQGANEGSDPEIEEELSRNDRKFALRDQSDSESENDLDRDEPGTRKIPVEDEVEGFEEEDEDEKSTSIDRNGVEVPTEPFNLKQERGEGTFEDGAYTADQETGTQYDNWLEDVSDKDLKKTAAAHKLQESRQSTPQNRLSVQDAFDSFSALLAPTESPLEAIAAAKGQTKKIQRLTDAASLLLPDYPDIYRLEREQLSRLSAKLTGRPFKRKLEDTEELWEFRWAGSSDTHGPHTGPEMQAWLDHDYFKKGEVSVRLVGESHFVDVTAVTFAR